MTATRAPGRVAGADLHAERAARRAREGGAGWAEIGRAAGSTAQAAQQRYSRPLPEPATVDGTLRAARQVLDRLNRDQ